VDETVTEVVLGMAKGRVRFETDRNRSGAGKRTSSELDILRLVYAAKMLSSRGVKVHAYFALLRDSEGRSTKETVNAWLNKYDGDGYVQIIERQLTSKETAELEKEKKDNAAAQERRGGNATAAFAKKLAEDWLQEHIRQRHPNAAVGRSDHRPFAVDWDAWYIIRERAEPLGLATST
jgi:hypothetical protein